MKKIGIILDSTYCDKYLYEIIDELVKSSKVELFYLINNHAFSERTFAQKITSLFSRRKLSGFVKWLPFKLISAIEFKLLSITSREAREHNVSLSIDKFVGSNKIYLNPIFSSSKLTVQYPASDIEKIKSLDLDIIIRGNAPGIFKGDIINSSKKGIISFHHGDNRWNRGGPPAFWEVYLRKPSTGFIIQILTEELDAGSVLFRGEVTTKRSYAENIINLYKFSHPYLSRIILQYAENDSLPKAEGGSPFDGPLLVAPSPWQSLIYLSRTDLYIVKQYLSKHIFNKHQRWGVGFTQYHWQSAILRKGIRIKNIPNHYFADPFVVTRNGRTVCYVEDYDYKYGKGSIAAVELFDRSYTILGTVIDEQFHMSFPFVFEYNNEMYMVPEVSGSHSIRLYKCIKYPMEWEYQNDIMSNVDAVDPMIFSRGDVWWLLFNKIEHEDANSILVAFYGENPLSGNWISHSLNPLVFNSNIARNGGILVDQDGFTVRVRQKQGFDSYGESLTLAKIKDISPSSFIEEEVGQVTPDFFYETKGIHHMHSNNRYTVYDFNKIERIE
ncbi:hypothetical protein [Candidatus Electronema sp. PJ]|uniref:glucosamine inositolphosphorylceramide transferase family protein n=1 Tax=Candidatus Electronema sp. PJ TaxID=3401572 RepID=UPI003AA92301